jgi:trehalose/maltose hydrolase-like predicted phosphorylase
MQVMPPDEYVDGVDDGILANFGASTILRKAVAMAKAAGREPGANWTDVAEKIYIPFDKQKQYHPEYAGFEPGKVAPKDEWNGGHGADKVKQADAILIGFPYDMNMSAAVRKNDLEIYGNCTDGGSVAMTWGMFAVGWLDAVRKVNAYFLMASFSGEKTIGNHVAETAS